MLPLQIISYLVEESRHFRPHCQLLQVFPGSSVYNHLKNSSTIMIFDDALEGLKCIGRERIALPLCFSHILGP
jgi:hypothetical protein